MGVFYLALKNLRIKRTKKCNYTSLCRFFVFVFLILAPAKSIGQDIRHNFNRSKSHSQTEYWR